jgi:hypothetical protein
MARPITAKEHSDSLARDPKIQAMRAAQERSQAERMAFLDADEKPLVKALTAAGWPEGVRQCGSSRSVWDLVNTPIAYPHLLETLADHVVRPYHLTTREGIARALAVKEARGTRVPRVLMDELKKRIDPTEGANSYRWVLINTLVFIGDRSLLEEVNQLLSHPMYASVREDLLRLARALQRSRKG